MAYNRNLYTSSTSALDASVVYDTTEAKMQNEINAELKSFIIEEYDPAKVYIGGEYCLRDGQTYRCTLSIADSINSYYVTAEYDSSKTYAVNNYCMHNGRLYHCTTAITVPEAWDDTHWGYSTATGEWDASMWELVNLADDRISKKGGVIEGPIIIDGDSAGLFRLYGTPTNAPSLFFNIHNMDNSVSPPTAIVSGTPSIREIVQDTSYAGLIVNGSTALVLGAGEAGTNAYSNDLGGIQTGHAEDLWLLSDGSIHVYSGCNTIANAVKTLDISSDGQMTVYSTSSTNPYIRGDVPYLALRSNLNYVGNTATGNKNAGVAFYDRDGKNVGVFRTRQTGSRAQQLHFEVSNYESGSAVTQTFDVGVNSNGTKTVSFSDPTAWLDGLGPGLTKTTNAADIIKTTPSGVEYTAIAFAQFGKVAQLRIAFKRSSAISGSVLIGTLATNKCPATYASATTSVANHDTKAYIETGGQIYVNGTLAANTVLNVFSTYLLA